jgi:hypothetical protein
MALKLSSEYSDQQFRLANGVYLKIEPFGPKKFKFFYLLVQEKIGGELVNGHLKLGAIEQPKQDKVIEKTNYFEITIKQDKPVEDEYKIRCFKTGFNYSPEVGIYDIDFICVPEGKKDGTFCTKTKRKMYKKKKVRDVIEQVWGESDAPMFRWKTEANPPAEDWYQDRWTDHEFLQKLCLSINKNTLYGFSFEGLIIKDIYYKDRIDGFPEPHRIVAGFGSMQPIQDKIEIKYSPKLYRPIENACTDGEYLYGREISKNFEISVHEDTFWICHSEVNERNSIYKHNSRLLEGGLYNRIYLRYTDNLPPLRLMDTIKYGKNTEKEEPTISTYMVTAVNFYLSGDKEYVDGMGAMMSFTFELRGTVDQAGQELPDGEDQDPFKK